MAGCFQLHIATGSPHTALQMAGLSYARPIGILPEGSSAELEAIPVPRSTRSTGSSPAWPWSTFDYVYVTTVCSQSWTEYADLIARIGQYILPVDMMVHVNIPELMGFDGCPCASTVMDAYDRANAPTPQKLRKGLSEPHDRSLLWFAYLAFDIIEAIVEGCPTRFLTIRLLLLRLVRPARRIRTERS
jgi:hypothetical protein